VEYPGETPDKQITTANELHLPVGRPARITLVANDVIHSFWVPNLSGKEDLIPGRVNRLVVTPRRTGVFRGQCAEFCGLQHAKMALDVTVQTPADFEAWKARAQASAAPPAEPLAAAGQQVFLTKACVMCHRISGTDAGGVTGPDLTHVAGRATLAAGTLPNGPGGLAAWIADPQGIKPGTSMPRVPLTGPELNAVVAYLETLE
jgi:cytochrome c oxidase subunit 2